MARFCLTLQAKNEFKKALKEKKITPEILVSLKTSEARQFLFGKYVGKENASQVNALFEKAILKPNQVEAMIDASKQVSGLKPETKRTFISKIRQLDKLFNESEIEQYFDDLVKESLGVKLTEKDFEVAKRLSENLEKEALKESEFGTPTLEYLKLRKEFSDYLDSLKPTSQLRVATQTIGRGMMLASVKSPLLNIESNSVNALINSAERRIEEVKLGGVNNDYGKKYRKFVNKVYLETGYDLTRILSIEDQKLVRGEKYGTTQGKGLVRKVGRVVEDIVFKKLQGYPDVVFSGIAFSDRANIMSTRLASEKGFKGKELKQKALDIFKDATRINPKTIEGQEVRNNAIADAQYSTYTNKSRYSDFSLAIRDSLNKVTGDFRLGDQIMPFVKTPANVIGAGIDSSGTLVPFDLVIRMGKGLNNIRKGDRVKDAFGESFKGFAKKVIVAGLGMTFAYLLSNLFKKEDFIGEYPTSEKERKLLELKQARERSVKIGNKWVSLDFFGVLAAPMVGFLYAKKYGKNLSSTVWNYYQGVLSQAKSLPGLDEFKDVIDSVKEIGTSSDTLEDKQKQFVNFSIDFVKSRSIPAIVSDTAKAFDRVERRMDKGIFDKIFASIPGLRQTLSEKRNIFGEPIPATGIISTYLFGTRVKVNNNNDVIQELNRLSETNNLPAITDVEKTSSRAKALKMQIGDEKFDRAKTEFGKELYLKFKKTISTGKYTYGEKTYNYKKEDDEGKKLILDKIKDVEFEKMLKKYGYKKPKK